MHNCESVKPGSEIVDDDSRPFGQALQLPYRRRLQNVEDTKKYKAREEGFPTKRYGNQCDELASHFVDHYKLRIFDASSAYHTGSGGDSDERNHDGGSDRGPRTRIGRDAPA